MTEAPYGAKGNGNTDDTAAIQHAIDDTGRHGGGMVVLPPGNYLVDALRIESPDVTVSGVSNAFNWAGRAGASTIIAAPRGTGPVFSVGADRVTLQALSIVAAQGPIERTAISATGCDATTLVRLGISGVGGIALGAPVDHGSVTGFLVEDVGLEGYRGQHGFRAVNCAVGFFNRCNASPAGRAGSAIANYAIADCESINLANSEANGTPQYNLWLDQANDTELYDFEANGATTEQIRLQHSTDVIFHRLYVLQDAPVGLHVVDATIVGINGGWIGGAEQRQIWLDSSKSGSTYSVLLQGLVLDAPARGHADAAILDITNNVSSLSMVGCALRADAKAGNGHSPSRGLRDRSTAATRRIALMGNVFEGFEDGDVPVAVETMPNLGSVSVEGNPGFNPAGQQVAPAVPGSGAVITNPFPFPCAVYLTGGTVAAVRIDGQATGTTSGTFHVGSGQHLAIEYSSRPRWRWFGM